MNIVMRVSSIKDLSVKERILFLRKFFDGRHEGSKNIGILKKFNNSVGYSKVEYQRDKNDIWSENAPEIEDRNYSSPYSLFIKDMYFFNKGNEIVTFVVKNERIYHTNKKFSYNTLEMVIKLQNFLYKVFPDSIKIEISFEKERKIPLKDFTLSYFVTCLAESSCIDNEFSAHRMLKEKEKEYVIDFFNNIGATDIEFEQYYCETCAEHHPDHPYHTEMFFTIRNF